MTKTIPKPETRSIAEAIRRSRRPESQVLDFSEQAQRLKASMDVASAWMEAAHAKSGEPGHLFQLASTTYEELQQELARVCLEAEVHERHKIYERVRDELGDEAAHSKDLKEEARLASLSDALSELLCVLPAVPEEFIGSDRARYRMMGAVVAAREAADAELERLNPRSPRL